MCYFYIVPFYDPYLRHIKGSVFITDTRCILSVTVAASNLTAWAFVFILLQGNQYWRFEGDVLDEDYPRDISVGFDGIPEGVDAAFAIPAPSHRGKEKAYFFKGIFVGTRDIFHYFKSSFCPVPWLWCVMILHNPEWMNAYFLNKIDLFCSSLGDYI